MRMRMTTEDDYDDGNDDARVEEVAVATLMDGGESISCANDVDATAMLIVALPPEEEEEEHPDHPTRPMSLTSAQTQTEVAATDDAFSPDVILVIEGEEYEDEVIGRVIDSSTAHATATSTIATVASYFNHPWTAQRAEFVSATVIKKTADDNLGIAFAGRSDENCSNYMRIVALHENGMLHYSPLRVGDQLLSVCSKSCLELNMRTVGALLRQAQGIVSIVARNATGNSRLVEAMVEKADPTSPVGIAFRRNTHGSLEVSKVIASGLFAHSLLNIGDRVISINNIPCRQGMSAQEAVEICRASCRFVTILTESQGLTGVVVASAEQGEELGGLHAGATAFPVVVPPKKAITEENWEPFHHHPCYCIWMIIISMSVMGLLIFEPFK